MSAGSFNGVFSPYSRDWERDEFYARQDAERRERELVDRATHWLASKLVGQTFTSIEDLRFAAVQHVTEWQQGPLDDDMANVIKKAVTLLWIGAIANSLVTVEPVRAVVTHDPRSTTFIAA
jgi:hypothetical protein